MYSELLPDSPNWQADSGPANQSQQEPVSLLTFVPKPLFMLPIKPQLTDKRGKRSKEFEFTFANPLIETEISQKFAGGNQRNTAVVINRINALQQPIDTYLTEHDTIKQQISEYKRLPNSEVLLSENIFVQLGLCQPAWVSLESQSAYSHVVIAYLASPSMDSQ